MCVKCVHASKIGAADVQARPFHIKWGNMYLKGNVYLPPTEHAHKQIITMFRDGASSEQLIGWQYYV